MFDQTFVNSAGAPAKPWVLALSFTLQIAGVATALVASLFFTEALPQARLLGYLVAPLPPVARPAELPAARRSSASPRQFHPFAAPTSVPREVRIFDDSELQTAGDAVVGALPGVPGAGESNPLGGLLGVLPIPAPRQAAAAQAQTPPPSKPSPVGGDVQAAKLIRKVMPVYPPIARQTRVSGKVRFTAIVAVDGTIKNLQLLDGHPFLVAAAREAIQQWLYRPTFLNSQPVEVVTQIEVTFLLGQ